MAIQFDNSNNFSVTLAAPSTGGSTLTFPTSDGTIGQTLITSAAGVLSWGAIPAAATSGLTGTINTTGTNATIHIDALTVSATGASTDQHIALIPGGAGNIYGYIPATAKGTGSFNLKLDDIVVGNSTISGNNSVFIGGGTNFSVAETKGHTAITSFYTSYGQNYNVGLLVGNRGITIPSYIGVNAPSNDDGYNVGAVLLASSGAVRLNGTGQTAIAGEHTRTAFDYEHAIGGYGYDAPSYLGNPTRYSFVHLVGQTTNATPTGLYAKENTSLGLSLVADTAQTQAAYQFWGTVVCASSSTSGSAKAWEFSGCAKGFSAASYAFVGTPTVTALHGDTAISAYAVAITITSGVISVTVTGGASDTVNWNCQFNFIKVGAK